MNDNEKKVGMKASQKIFIILIFTVTLTSNIRALEEPDEKEIMSKVSKYFDALPDVEPKYVINEGISKLISRYYDGKVNAFPLYRVSLKIDHTPVKIPWTLNQASPINKNNYGNKFKYIKLKKKAKQ